MCINKKRFYNKWLHSWQWSDCGKCSACQQAKANKRTQRIKHAVYDGYITLFVTLTYRNINIPYIRKDEIKDNSPFINIYRDCHVRRVRLTDDYKMAYKYYRERQIVSQYDCFKHRVFAEQKDISKLSKLRGQSDSNKIGVIFYKDVQDFEKRLRINIQRHYHINKSIYLFKCAEYGPTSQRPHFHLLISIPQENLAQLQSAIIESWPYDSRIQSAKSIQVARNAASYVSSYVNRGSDFPSFLANKGLQPRHSFSKGYGSTFAAFSLENMLKSLNRGDLRYHEECLFRSTSDDYKLYPQYACNRYFAKCYGYSRLTYDEIVQCCVDPYAFVETSDILPRMFLKAEYHPVTHQIVTNSFTNDYEYDFIKVRSFCNHFIRLRSRFCRDFVYYENGRRFQGLPENRYSYELFADYYYRFWRCYYSTLLRSQYEKIQSVEEIPQLFDNLDEVYNKGIRSDVLCFVNPLLLHFSEHKLDGVYSHPSFFERNINLTISLIKTFTEKYKRRKLTNRCMVASKFNV